MTRLMYIVRSAAFLVVVRLLVYSGILATIYEFMWRNTTGEMWTYIMRRNGWLLIVPSLLLMAAVVHWRPRHRWLRWARFDVAFLLGLLAGHVFWGSTALYAN